MGPSHVVPSERDGVNQRLIHVRICCEVDNGIHCKLLEDSCYTVGVAQIASKKVEVGKMLDGVYVALGRAVIENIKAEYRIPRTIYLEEVPNEPAPTEMQC